jgi:hypothetical protein
MFDPSTGQPHASAALTPVIKLSFSEWMVNWLNFRASLDMEKKTACTLQEVELKFPGPSPLFRLDTKIIQRLRKISSPAAHCFVDFRNFTAESLCNEFSFMSTDTINQEIQYSKDISPVAILR